MKINVEIGSKKEKDNSIQVKIKKTYSGEKRDYSIELDIKKTIDGRYVIDDHEGISIVIDPVHLVGYLYSKQKYDKITQDLMYDLVKFLNQKGVIRLEDVEGGNLYGSMQFKVLGIGELEDNEGEESFSFSNESGEEPGEDDKALYILLYCIHEWIQENTPDEDLIDEVVFDKMADETEGDIRDPEETAKEEEEKYKTSGLYSYSGLRTSYFPSSGFYIMERQKNKGE